MVAKACAQCGNDFWCKPSHAPKKTYCSKSCMAEGYKTRLKGSANPNHRNAGNRTCERCGRIYKSYISSRRFCSQSCGATSPANAAHCKAMSTLPRKQRFKPGRNPKRLTCFTCQCVFYSYGLRKYCTDCTKYGKFTRFIKTCIVCGTEKASFKKTCSEECLRMWQSISQRGTNSHRWKGGKTSLSMTLRCSLEYSLWRKEVFAKADFKCALCERRGGKLAAHHIKPFAKYLELALEQSNGIALCWPCHRFIRGRESSYEVAFQKLAIAQKEWHATWGGQVCVANSIEEALEQVIRLCV